MPRRSTSFCAQRRMPTVGKTNATHWTQTPTFGTSWEKSHVKSMRRQETHAPQQEASCVDGPRLARDHFACSTEVACSHVSGLLMQSGWTAGPDGVREPRPHHSNGIDVPMKRQVSLGCVGSTDCAITRHCSLASSSARLRRPKPPRPRAGNSPAGASPPRRCVPSCWPAPPPPPGSAAGGAARSPRDRHWSPSSVADWRWRR